MYNMSDRLGSRFITVASPGKATKSLRTMKMMRSLNQYRNQADSANLIPAGKASEKNVLISWNVHIITSSRILEEKGGVLV